ncbi:uncharacterized protein RBU33_008651 [Hipposideros larvatus]
MVLDVWGTALRNSTPTIPENVGRRRGLFYWGLGGREQCWRIGEGDQSSCSSVFVVEGTGHHLASHRQLVFQAQDAPWSLEVPRGGSGSRWNGPTSPAPASPNVGRNSTEEIGRGKKKADGEEWWWQTPEAQCLWPCVAVQGMVEADKEMLQEVELELAMLGAEEVYSQCSGNGKVSRGPKLCRAPHSRVQL